MKHDISQQLADYRGVLHWDSFTDGQGNLRPAIDVPLYIKDHPIPMRKPKLTEVSTITMLDPKIQRETGVSSIFWGSPEALQTTISGWVFTPVTPVSSGGQVIGYKWNVPEYPTQNITYAELISAYIEGRLNLSVGGALQRTDPNYYITPYGQKYLDPIITVWEPQSAVNPVKQQFNMTLVLEK